MNRDIRLDVARCVMNYMVILLHAWAGFQYVEQGTIEFVGWTFICSNLCWMAVPTFFLISGYLLFRSFTFESFLSKLKSRLKRLAVPYIAWNALFVVFYLSLSGFFPRLAARSSMFGLDTWSGAISKIANFTVHPIDGPLWYIRALMYFVILSPVLFWLMRLWKGRVTVMLVIGWCVVERIMGIDDMLHMILPSYGLVCFVIGGALAMNGKDIFESFKNPIWLIVGLVACVVRWRFSNSDYCCLLPILEAPSLISLVAHLNVERLRANRFFNFMQDMSFFAYAGHFLFCSMVLHTFAPLFKFMGIGKFTVLILIFMGLGIPLMAGIFAVSKRFMPRVLKVFDGSF